MALEKFNLPVGRIVEGHPMVPQNKTNFQTNQNVLDKDGKPIIQYRCKIAYAKDVFLRDVLPYLYREAATAYPANPQTGVPNVSRDFAWKFVDGDSNECPKRSKVPYNAREGYPGCYVLTISTEAFMPKVFKYENGSFFAVEENQLKTGDYVVANVDVKVHTNNDGGLYINPNGFNLVGYGTAIASQGGINPEQAFGNQQYQLPPGASSAPVGGAAPAMAPAPMAAPVQHGYAPPPVAPVQGGYAAPAAPAYQAPAAPAYQAPVAPLPAPAHDFVQNAGVQPGYPQPAAPMQGGYAAPAPVVGAPQPVAPLPAIPTATPVISSHGNGMPPLPPAR